MNDRFIKLMHHFHLSPSLFADEIGVNRPAISHIISGRNKPGVDLIQKVLKRFPEVSTDWILMGTGSMLHGTVNPTPVAKQQEPVLTQAERNDLFSYTEKDTTDQKSKQNNAQKHTDLSVEAGKNAQIKRITIYFTDGSFKDFEEVN